MASDPAREYACPSCEKVFDHPGKLMMHRVSAHKYRKGDDAAGGGSSAKAKSSPRTPPKPKPDAPLPGEAEIRAAAEAFTGNMRGVGMIVRPMAPHFGTTLAGVEVEKGTPGAILEGGRSWMVRSRAVMAEPLLVDQMKRDARIYRLVKQVNALFEGGTAVEVAGGLLAGAAVDVGVSPAIGFQMGPLPVQPIPMVIGDVLDYVAMEREANGEPQGPPQYPEAPGERQPAEEPVVQPAAIGGGVEGT